MPTAVNLSWTNDSKGHTGQTLYRVSTEDNSILETVELGPDVRTYSDLIPDDYSYGLIQYRIATTLAGNEDYAATSDNSSVIQYIPTTFTADPSIVSVEIGSSAAVLITIAPEAIAKHAIYTVTNTSIATITNTETGINVNGIVAGSTEIIVRSASGEVIATLPVTVTDVT